MNRCGGRASFLVQDHEAILLPHLTDDLPTLRIDLGVCSRLYLLDLVLLVYQRLVPFDRPFHSLFVKEPIIELADLLLRDHFLLFS